MITNALNLKHTSTDDSLLDLCGFSFSSLVSSMDNHLTLSDHKRGLKSSLNNLVFFKNRFTQYPDVRKDYMERAVWDADCDDDLITHYRVLLCMTDGILHTLPLYFYGDWKYMDAYKYPMILKHHIHTTLQSFRIPDGSGIVGGYCGWDGDALYQDTTGISKFYFAYRSTTKSARADQNRIGGLLLLSHRNYKYTHYSDANDPDECCVGPYRRDQVLFIRMLIHLYGNRFYKGEDNTPTYNQPFSHSNQHRAEKVYQLRCSWSNVVNVYTHPVGQLNSSSYSQNIYHTWAKPINPVAYRRMCIADVSYVEAYKKIPSQIEVGLLPEPGFTQPDI